MLSIIDQEGIIMTSILIQISLKELNERASYRQTKMYVNEKYFCGYIYLQLLFLGASTKRNLCRNIFSLYL